MTCVREGELRAFLDDELPPATHQEVARHVAECADCRVRLEEIERTVASVRQRLLAASPAAEPDAQQGLARIRAQVHQQDAVRPNILRRLSMGSRNRVWRPILAGVVVLAILVGAFSFAPTRALARQLLSVFRVRRFAVIEVNPSEASLEEAGRALQEKLFKYEPQVIVDEPAREVASIDEARAAAGFDVRLPSYLPYTDTVKFGVKGRTEYAFRFDREGLTTLLQLAGMDPDQVSADFAEGTVNATASAMAYISQGPLGIVQVLDPVVDYPEGIAPSVIGEAGLRILGVSPADARRISESIDWTSTMLLPVPKSVAQFQEVTVAGVPGVLVVPQQSEGGQEPAVLLWQKGDVVYLVAAPRSLNTLLQIAESMF